MTTAPAPARPAPAPAAPRAGTAGLDLETRLAAVDAAMTVRLDLAHLQHDVRTAHLTGDPLDLADVITTAPPALPGAPAAAPTTYRTPVADLLARAQHRMETGGWCSGTLVDDAGAVCMMGAVRTVARGDRGLEADALAVLREALHRRFGSDDVSGINDAHGSGRTPVRMLGEAAGLADARGL
jgi:hypothetical protein